MIRFFAIGALLFAALVAVATAREARLGAAAMRDSDGALAAGNWDAAIARAHDAAECAAPASPYPRAAYERLASIARGAEARGDDRTAIDAWGAMRSAATATEAPFNATRAWIAMADDGVVRAGAHPLAPTAEVHASDDVLRASLARADTPPLASVTLLAFGALAFFAGLGRLTWVARDVASLKRERFALLASLAGFAMYALACLRG